MLEGTMRFVSAWSDHRIVEDAQTVVHVVFDAQEFEDQVGSWLGGPWEVGLILLDLPDDDEFTESGKWLKEGEARGWVTLGSV